MSKNITISEEAYKRLAHLKKETGLPSFTEVILEVAPDPDWQKRIDRLWKENPFKPKKRAKKTR